jgi:hypothetical protein
MASLSKKELLLTFPSFFRYQVFEKYENKYSPGLAQ